MRGLRGENCAQSAVIDAILFMAVMLVASAVMIGSSGLIRSPGFSSLQQYTDDFSQTYMAVELNELLYIDSSGNQTSTGSAARTVCQALCDECLIVRNHSIEGFESYNSRLLSLGNSILRPGLDFAVSCDNGAVFITNRIGEPTELPEERCASQIEIWPGDSSATKIRITIFVWVS